MKLPKTKKHAFHNALKYGKEYVLMIPTIERLVEHVKINHGTSSIAYNREAMTFSVIILSMPGWNEYINWSHTYINTAYDFAAPLLDKDKRVGSFSNFTKQIGYLGSKLEYESRPISWYIDLDEKNRVVYKIWTS